jgi:hypothetical protein
MIYVYLFHILKSNAAVIGLDIADVLLEVFSGELFKLSFSYDSESTTMEVEGKKKKKKMMYHGIHHIYALKFLIDNFPEPCTCDKDSKTMSLVAIKYISTNIKINMSRLESGSEFHLYMPEIARRQLSSYLQGAFSNIS